MLNDCGWFGIVLVLFFFCIERLLNLLYYCFKNSFWLEVYSKHSKKKKLIKGQVYLVFSPKSQLCPRRLHHLCRIQSFCDLNNTSLDFNHESLFILCSGGPFFLNTFDLSERKRVPDVALWPLSRLFQPHHSL